MEFVVRSAIGTRVPLIELTDDTDPDVPITADLPIESLDPSRQFPWSVTLTGLPWLTVTKSSGQTGVDAGARVQFLPDAVRTLPNSVYSATLRVESSTAGITPIEVPVYVALYRPFVDAVSPAAESAGFTGQVLVSGDRFGSLTPIDRVLFGDVAAPAFTTRSRANGAIQLRVDVPAGLAAGRHAVTLESQNGRVSQGRAELILVDDVDYTVAGPTSPLSNSGRRYVQAFDPSRRTIFSLPVGAADYVYAARFDGTAWVQTHSTALLQACLSATLTANARSLVAYCQTLDSAGFIDIDPDSLEVRGVSPAPGGGSIYPQGLVALADGTAWIGADSSAAAFVPRGVQGSAPPQVPLYYLAASGAGNAVLSYRAITPNAPLVQVDPFTGVATSFLSSYPLSLHTVRGDRFGTRWALIGEVSHSARVVAVYDAGGVFRGQVDYRPTGSYVDAFIDEDGGRLYILGASLLPEINGGIAVYDLTQPAVNNNLVLLEKIPMTAMGAQFVGVTPDGTQVLTSNGDQVQATRIGPAAP